MSNVPIESAHTVMETTKKLTCSTNSLMDTKLEPLGVHLK